MGTWYEHNLFVRNYTVKARGQVYWYTLEDIRQNLVEGFNRFFRGDGEIINLKNEFKVIIGTRTLIISFT